MMATSLVKADATRFLIAVTFAIMVSAAFSLALWLMAAVQQ